MVAKYWPAGGGGGGPALPSGPATASRGRQGPLSARLRRRSDFERLYRSGRRFRCTYFTAFALSGQGPGSRLGFSVPRTLGQAVVRNGLRRRLREAVRLHYQQLAPGWDVVLSPRPSALDADFRQMEAEVARYFAGLKAPPDGREQA